MRRRELIEKQARLGALNELELEDESELSDLKKGKCRIGESYNYTLFDGLVYEGSDLKMKDMFKKSQWKRDLLAEAEAARETDGETEAVAS